MPTLEWSAKAVGDLLAILDHISDDNPDAAQTLRDEILLKAVRLTEQPKLYRQGRVPGTREMVVRPNYLVVHRETARTVTILRVLHASQMWP